MVILDLASLDSLSLRISGTKKTYDDTGKHELILSYNTRNEVCNEIVQHGSCHCDVIVFYKTMTSKAINKICM